jgi:hypothetical protein
VGPALSSEEEPPRSVFDRDPAVERAEEIGFAPNALSESWPEAEDRAVFQQENQNIDVPRIFTTREAAEERLRYYNDPDVELKTTRKWWNAMEKKG